MLGCDVGHQAPPSVSGIAENFIFPGLYPAVMDFACPDRSVAEEGYFFPFDASAVGEKDEVDDALMSLARTVCLCSDEYMR
jgi:hypothetical protein